MRMFLSVLLCLFGVCLNGCKKYLSQVYNEAQVAPKSIADYQTLLDNDLMTHNSTPGLGPLGCDDYFVSPTVLAMATPPSSTAYNWQANIFLGQPSPSWNQPYQAIFYCNTVLGGLAGLPADSSGPAYSLAWGTALFYRAFHYYYLEETFGEPYDPLTASQAAGIVLRLDETPGKKAGRVPVRDVFTQLIQDLKTALPLLPTAVSPAYRNRPSRPAAFALLARTYLTMQQYADAGAFADSCIRLSGQLLDYNALDTTSAHPFSAAGNIEVLFMCSAFGFPMQYASSSLVDTLLYRSYDPNDLRRALFFRKAPPGNGSVYFKGQYTGLLYLFSGLASDETWLIRAECRARGGDVLGAMADLNTLLANRWRSGQFQPLTASSTDEALGQILAERRKELLFRELRWADLRRLNLDPRWAVTLVRDLGLQKDTLLPGSPRYAYPLPDDEVRENGIAQNPR